MSTIPAVRNALILPVLCLLATTAGCGPELSSPVSTPPEMERGAAADVPTQLPLPPNPTSTVVESNRKGTRVSVTATYKNMEQVELLDFYRDYFQQNGWITGMSSESEDETAYLYYVKRRTEMDVGLDVVSVEKRQGEIEVCVSFSEHPYTSDEFQTLCRESMPRNVSDIVAGVAKAYAGLPTYRDTGTHQFLHEGRQISRSTSKPALLRRTSSTFRFAIPF
jgi:hypothetical protein